ncbi:MAG: aminoacyl-tRNA hydrolase [Flavobacteriaceae bacterium]|nr:aminoacyl-tRNA hydrolase [Flavobacteriaceae bacterium]
MNKKILHNELKFKAIRSGGPGGQHANKVSSKVVLFFDVQNSNAFTEEELELVFKNLKNRLTKENILILSSEETRSQHKNKEIVLEKFDLIIKNALKLPKKRKPTKPSRSSIKKRLNTKKIHAFKKVSRRRPDIAD